MSISKEEILKVTKLANLPLEESELEKYSPELGNIIDYNAEKLKNVATDGVEPTAHVTGEKARLREDETEASLPAEKALQNAKETKDGFFKVPQILEGE